MAKREVARLLEKQPTSTSRWIDDGNMPPELITNLIKQTKDKEYKSELARAWVRDNKELVKQIENLVTLSKAE